jgi:hypothetical protein
MRNRLATAAAAAVLAGLLVTVLAGPAAAHEERQVGKYRFAVGFGDEPAYAGEKNSVQLLLVDAKDKPVTDLGDTLKVSVSAADAQGLNLAVVPNFEVGEFGAPGDYRAWFIPTAPGNFTFRFTGTIKGQRVDQSFTSSPTTFDEVADPGQVQYPTKEPSNGQLATRQDRESARVDAALAAARASARREASGARTLAVVALVVGVVGLLAAAAAGVAVARRRA